MTFEGLQGHAFRLLRDPNQTRYSLDYIKKWLNDAERQYCTETDFSVKKSTAISTVSGTREYDMPTDCLSLREVYYAGRPLAVIDIENTIHDSGDESGAPTSYYFESKKIGLEPVPTATATLTLVYYSMGGTMAAASDIPIIPTEHHLYLVYYACMLACIEGDDTRLGVFSELWDRAIRKAKADIAEKYPWPQVDQRGGAPEMSRYNHDLEGF